MAKVQLIVAVLIYWTMLIFSFSSVLSSPLSSDYNVTSVGVNVSSVDLGSEINSGGFFGGVIGIFSAAGRFFGLITLGIGLPSGTPAWVQFIFTSFNLIVFIIALLLVISMFWDG